MLVLSFLAHTRVYPNIGRAKSLHSFTRVLNVFFYSGLWVKAICALPSPPPLAMPADAHLLFLLV